MKHLQATAVLILIALTACSSGPPIADIEAAGKVVCACETNACAEEKWEPLMRINMEYGNPKVQAKWDDATKTAYSDAFAVPQKCKNALSIKEHSK